MADAFIWRWLDMIRFACNGMFRLGFGDVVSVDDYGI